MELLSEIFHIGLDEYDPDDYHAIEYLSTISSICSTWRGAALGTPSLWRRIFYMDHDRDPRPKTKTKKPAIPRHTKDRLIAYLSRSKSCGILLRLHFGARSLKIQAVKRILHPHLSRCLSIWLSFMLESNMGDFLPLPGDLCQLTEFTCVSNKLDQSHLGSSGRARPPIFAEPGTLSLRKLILEHCRPSIDSINAQDLEDVRLRRIYNSGSKGATFISQCHSLTTLIITDFIPFDPEQPPFTLPNLMYLDTVGFGLLGVAHTPKLQTLILGVDHDIAADTVVRLPSLPALTTLCVLGDAISEEITGLMALNTGIRRLMLLECVGISDLVRLLKAEDMGSAANTPGTMLLPSLSWLLVCDTSVPDADGFHALFARRPTLRIEYEMWGPDYIEADELIEIIEELGQNDEPGVFEFRDLERRVFEREDEPQTGSADA